MANGKAGAPKGNQNARKGNEWQLALKSALASYKSEELQVKPGEALQKIAEKVIEAALKGSGDAWSEIGDRLDGKAKQTIEANVNHQVETGSEASLAKQLQKSLRSRTSPTVQ